MIATAAKHDIKVIVAFTNNWLAHSLHSIMPYNLLVFPAGLVME